MQLIRSNIPMQVLTKRFALIFLPIVIVFSIILLSGFRLEEQGAVKRIEGGENNRIEIAKAHVTQDFEGVDSDLRVIAQLPLLKSYLDSGSPFQRDALAEFFLVLSKEKRQYNVVRYLNTDGQEMVRVNYNDGNPTIVPQAELQNKLRRYYFNDTFRLNQGEVYVSPFDLGIENNRLVIPFMPTIRFGIPVFDSSGRKKGILLYDYLGSNLLQNFQNVMQGVGHSGMLLNSDGYWLGSANHEDEWGFMQVLGRSERTFGHDFADEWRTISKSEAGTLRTANGLFIYSTVHPLLSGQQSSSGSDTVFGVSHQKLKSSEYYWKVVSFIPNAVLSGTAFYNKTGNRLLLVAIYLAITLFAWLIAFQTLNRKQAENALLANEEKFRRFYELSPLGIALTDMQGHYIEFNESFRRICGYTKEELNKLDYWALTPKKYEADEARQLESLTSTGRYGPYVKEYVRKDGNLIPLRLNGMLVTGSDGLKCIWSIVEDITESKLADENMRIAATAFESQEGMLITDADNIILRVNRAFTNITGYSAEDVIGKSPRILSSGRNDSAFYTAMWDSINKTGAWVGEIWNRRKNGEVYPEHLTIAAVKSQDGIVTNYVASFADITQRKLAEDEINNLAFFDPLTKLPNRRLLVDRLKQAMASSKRNSKEGALLFIDLDDFKSLNDTLGHDKGDMLLQQVAHRLTSSVREGDTVARLGGDEFVVMLEDLNDHSREAADQTKAVGEKILAAFNKSYQLASHEHHITPSIGATLFSDHQQSIDELLKRADIAMYQAKKAGRNTLRFFDPQMQENINVRVALEIELRKAIDNQQFQLYYQIQVDSSRRPLGAEALIRWLHPERGLVPPVQFIPLAEETGLILPIGQWVLDTACAQLKAWQNDELTRELVLAVNVSAKQFRQADFVAQVQAVVQRHAINPMLLKLELTESLLLEDVEVTIATMNELKKIGVRFSLDDFGTGYSSLQYLKRLPLDQLKIDQSFVRDLASDSSDRAIVRTIIAMAFGLNIEGIAEGVETEEQRQFLMNKGCTDYQGYLFGKPMPIEQFDALLRVD